MKYAEVRRRYGADDRVELGPIAASVLRALLFSIGVPLGLCAHYLARVAIYGPHTLAAIWPPDMFLHAMPLAWFFWSCGPAQPMGLYFMPYFVLDLLVSWRRRRRPRAWGYLVVAGAICGITDNELLRTHSGFSSLVFIVVTVVVTLTVLGRRIEKPERPVRREKDAHDEGEPLRTQP